MSQDTVESKNDASIHDLTEYSFATSVLADHPKLITMFHKMLNFLNQYRHYSAVLPVIMTIEENLLILEIQYSHYQRVFARKGKVK